jgi:hypothetical protein
VKAEHAAYGRALAQAAETQAAHEAALAALEEAQAPLNAQIQQVWDAHQQAVADAARAVEAAVQNAARVQVECATAARARAKGKPPVFSDDEVALVQAAEAEVVEAQAAHAAAKDRFKAGVLPEHLDALDG